MKTSQVPSASSCIRSVLDESRFVFIEQWRSRKDLDAHGQLPLVRRLWRAFREEDSSHKRG